MSRAHRPFVLVLSLVLLAAGCSENDAQKIERVSGKAWKKASDMTLQATNELGLDLRSPDMLNDRSLNGRVQSRLKWDRQLRGSSISVQIEGDNVILSGTVADEAQRRRAVEIAESTAGVRKVAEKLQIGAPPQ